MKILVISDSHRRMSALDQVVRICGGKDAPQAVIHLGDHASDARYLRGKIGQRVISAPGNCDWGDEGPEEIIERLGGVDFLICHGHTLRVKQTLLPLLCRAREAEARAALFGHTHAPFKAFEEGILLLNPGALQDERCALIEAEAGEIEARLLSLSDLC